MMKNFKLKTISLILFFVPVLAFSEPKGLNFGPELEEVKTFENKTFIVRVIKNSFEATNRYYGGDITTKVPLIAVDLYEKETLKRIDRKELLRSIPMTDESLDMVNVTAVYADIGKVDGDGVTVMIEFFPLRSNMRLIECAVGFSNDSLTPFVCEERPLSELKPIPEEAL